MTYEEYETFVVVEMWTRQKLHDSPCGVCICTIKMSYDIGLPIAVASDIAEADSLINSCKNIYERI